MFDTVLGLPTHVLVVHLAVVVVPVAAVASVLVAVRRAWLLRLGWWVVGLDAVAALTTFVAKQSGEKLLTRLDRLSDGQRAAAVQTHVDRGADMLWYAIGLFGITLVLLLVARHRAAATFRPRTIPPYVAPVVAVLTVVAAVLAVVQVARVGHSGSSAVWKSTVDNSSARLR
ncbi:DUF2231 domain-containing protein [Streptomyces sp. SID3343]|uniref:DUF2231 domain-containing protein n=1 Tax=Streptomyces sp. SID3343 TaxID=2690260 RepID=UPI00136B1665|nr:DUF2231 domain-containing protein [Streptomyces sp. SID3343]MYW00457.1 hypothetical protein [Streptomyces sp. SID3343]